MIFCNIYWQLLEIQPTICNCCNGCISFWEMCRNESKIIVNATLAVKSFENAPRCLSAGAASWNAKSSLCVVCPCCQWVANRVCLSSPQEKLGGTWARHKTLNRENGSKRRSPLAVTGGLKIQILSPTALSSIVFVSGRWVARQLRLIPKH